MLHAGYCKNAKSLLPGGCTPAGRPGSQVLCFARITPVGAVSFLAAGGDGFNYVFSGLLDSIVVIPVAPVPFPKAGGSGSHGVAEMEPSIGQRGGPPRRNL
jgi:hypothetical protein